MSKDVHFNFRMPAELKEALEKAAEENKRSTSSEAVNRLHDSFQDPLDREAPAEWVQLHEAHEALQLRVRDLIDLLHKTQQALSDSQAMNMRLLSEKEAQAATARVSA